MCKTVAYLRVSTDKQDLSNQHYEIEQYAKRNELSIDQWIEVEMSSRKTQEDRKITELIQSLRKGDIIVVSELSRLARTIRGIHNIIADMLKKKASVHIIKQNLICKENDMTTKIQLNAFAMASEIERDLISQRTKNGLANAKARGVKLGNPNLKADNKVRIEKADKFAESLKEIVMGLQGRGLTQRAMVDELNKIGIKTQRGNQWHLTGLQRLIARIDKIV